MQTSGQTLNETAPQRSLSSLRAITVDSARVISAHKIDVAAQSDGLISELRADEGTTVKQGEVLLVIDNRVARAELEVAKKEYVAAQKQADQTAEVEYAEKASEVSDAEYEDMYRLYNKGSATYAEARRKQLEKERARLGIDVAKVKHEQEILAADIAQEKVKAAEVQLDLFNVNAPYEGVVVKRLRDRGEWIRAGEPVLKLLHMNEMKVEGFVPIDGISVAQLQGAPVRISVRINAQDVAVYNDYRIEFVSTEIEGKKVRVATRVQNQMVNGSWLLNDGMPAVLEIPLAN